MSWPKFQALSELVKREDLAIFLKPCGNNIKAFNGRSWEVGEKKTFAVL